MLLGQPLGVFKAGASPFEPEMAFKFGGGGTIQFRILRVSVRCAKIKGQRRAQIALQFSVIA